MKLQPRANIINSHHQLECPLSLAPVIRGKAIEVVHLTSNRYSRTLKKSSCLRNVPLKR